MISTLSKAGLSNFSLCCLRPKSPLKLLYLTNIAFRLQFPWFAIKLYSIRQRDQVAIATGSQIGALANAVRNTGGRGLVESLLLELLYAALNVPVFSELQRLTFIDLAGHVGQQVKYSPLMITWPFEVLGRKKDWDEDVVGV